MGKFNVWRFILATVLFAVLSQLIYAFIDPMLGMQYYTDPEYLSVWNKLMMPDETGQLPAEFMYMSVGFTLITALIFTLVYVVVKKGLPGKSLAAKGLMYGLLVFLVSNLSGTMMMYLLLNLPFGLLILWTVEGLGISLVGGMIVAGVNK